MPWTGISRNIVSRLRRFSLLRLREQRLWPLAATGLFGRAFAPGSKVAGAGGCRVRRNSNRSCGILCACALTILLSISLTDCLGSTSIASAIFLGLSPLAGVKPNLVVPPSNPFAGDATSVGNDAADATSASAGVPGTVLVRQPDYSVAGAVYTNVALTTSSGYRGDLLRHLLGWRYRSLPATDLNHRERFPVFRIAHAHVPVRAAGSFSSERHSSCGGLLRISPRRVQAQPKDRLTSEVV
jgi:hypothetical protein